MAELYKICIDPDAKAADRISAAKLFLDNAKAGDGEETALRVIFENADPECLK